MKRLVRFVLLTLGYLVAIVRVSARRLPKRASSSRNSRRRIGMLSGTGLALLGLVVAGNVLSPPASAVTDRSGSGSDACTVEVGNAAYADVTKNGDYCVVTVKTSTSVTFPSYVTTIGIIVVGGGGGGGTDGGAGGSGGETRYSASQGVTAGVVNVTIGGGGGGTSWATGGGANGSPTYVSGAGLNYTANGGYLGGGWNSCAIRYGPGGGSGGTGGSSATGGTGGNGTLDGCPGYGGFSYGGAGGNGAYVSTIPGINASFFAGGGGGGTCLGVDRTSSVTGAAGGNAGGGRGSDYYAYSGATTGFAGTPNTGGGGGAGAACDWSNNNYNDSTERTAGGAGGSGVALFSFLAKKLAFNQLPDGCFSNLAEACLQPAKVQLQDSNGSNLSTSGLTVTLVSASAGTLGGTLTANTDASGIATFNNFWITGLSVSNTTTLTFEIPGYRNIQTTITMMAYAEDLYVVPGSDSNGSFIGNTGIWLATASVSNISAATLQSQLTARDVLLRASAANTSTTLGNISWNTGAVVTETASGARTLTIKATRNVGMAGSARVTSSGQPLNVIVHTDSDGSNGGVFVLKGNSSSYPIETNGGSVAIGGGSGTKTWNSLTIPSSSSGGYAQFTGEYWGILLGTGTDTASNKLIYTNGGKIFMNGHSSASTSTGKLYGVAWESGRIDAGTGDIEIIGSTSGSPTTSNGENWGIGLGANSPNGNDRTVLVTSGTATLNGVYGTAGTSDYWGVYVGNSDVTTGSGGLNVTSTQRAIIAGSSTFTGTVNLGGIAPVVRGTNTFVGALNVTASAGDATLGGSQTLSTSGAVLKVKSTANVLVEANASIQTNRGRIVMWTRSEALESSTTQGYFSLDNGASIASNGGDIYIAGSSSTDANDLPAGHVYTNDSTNNLALKLGSSSANAAVSIHSGGGNIRMYGQTGNSSAHAMAVQSTTASSINAGGGRIDVHLVSSNTADNVFEAWNGGLTVTSSASADAVDGVPAIKWVANQTNSAATYNPIQSAGLVSMRATGGGDIDFTSTSANTGVYTFDNTKNFQLLSSSGQIRANFGDNGLNLAGGIADGFILGAVSGGSSSSNVVLTTNRLNDGSAIAAAAVVRTSGTVTIRPSAQSFSAAVALDGTWSFTGVTGVAGGNAGGLVIGRTGNTANITVSSAMTLAGDLEVFGGAVAFDGTGVTASGDASDVLITAGAFSGSASFSAGGKISITSTTFDGTGALTSSGANGISVTTTAGDLTTGANMAANTNTAGPITLKATGNIILNNNLTSAGGPITLWSDSDALNYGGILTAAASTITSNGGAVTLSGGLDITTGYAKATALIKSTANPGYSGIRLVGKIVSGAGDVTLRGQDNPSIGLSNHNSGIEGEKTASITTTSGDVIFDGSLANASTGTGNHIGVILGWGGTAAAGTNAYSTVSGDITIKGSAATLISDKGYGVWLFGSTISSTSGAILLDGSGGASSAYDLWIYGTDVSSTTGAVTAKTGTTGGKAAFDVAGSRFSSDTSVTLSVKTPTFSALELAGTGTKTIEPPTGAIAFGAAVSLTGVTISSTSTALTVGKSTNNSAVTLPVATSIAGPIVIYGGDVATSANLSATTATGSIAINANGTFTNSAAISSAGGNQPTTIKAQKAAITGSINSGTAATQITGFNSARTINIGVTNDTTDTLSLSDTELDAITAGTIRVGDATTGAITVSAAISIASANSNNLALRTAGNVTATNSATISATNLGIDAGGTISLGGSNGVTGNLALVASAAAAANGASYGSSGNYSVAAVDGITPIFGIGRNISLTSAPAIGATEVRYLNQTWSAPPVVTIKDEYGYVLSTKNLKAATYTTDVTDSGAPTLAGTTAVVSGGTQTFSALKFTTTPGATTLTFTTAGLAAGGTSSVTTGTYDVQGGEPTSLSITYDSTDAPAGKTGFGIKVTLKDVGGNTVSGPHATDAITVDVSDGDADSSNNATIVSGNTPSTVAGSANFSNLILGGKVGVSYTLTFTVTYVDTGSVTRTRSATQIVRLTPGDATRVKVQTAAAGFANRTNFTTQPAIAIKDAYDNTVTSSTAAVSVAIAEVSGSSTQALTGTTSVNAVLGVATFSGLGKTGLVGAKRLTYSASGLSSDTQDFTLAFGAAHHITPVISTNLVNNTVFPTQPVVTIQDHDGNTVESSTATVTLTSGDATIGGTLLNSSVAMDAVAGVANFAGKNVKLTGTVGAKTLTATVSGLSAVDSTVTITYGAATKLAITRQAAGAVNGVAFTTQPQVTVQDISGNPVTNSTATITVESSGSVLSGNSTAPTLVNGVATFSGLKLMGTKGTYVLTFKSTGLTDDFHSITVSYGAASKLVLTTAPIGFVNRTNFTTQPVVTVQDASGNTVENSSISIDVAIDSGSLTGTTQVAAVNGIATFSGLGKNGLVGSKRLTFSKTGGGLTADIFDFSLTHGFATQIVLTQNAAGAKSGQAFSTQPSLEVRDADGNLVDTGVAATASIRVQTGSSAYDTAGHTGANLTGPSSSDVVDAVAGVATFSGLRLEGVAASAYSLNFETVNTAGYNGIVTTQNIALTAGSQTQLRVVEQPSNIVAGVAFATAVKAEILDAWNNRVLDLANTVTIKPTLVADALATTVIDASKTGIVNSTGLVTFTGLTFTKAGTHYVQFTSSGLTAATSSSFVITNAAAHHLTWVTQPVGAKNDYAVKGAGNADPELEVRDQYQNPILVGAATTVDVTEEPSTTDVQDISGGTVVSDSNARVKFTNLVLRAKAGSYTLRFTATNGSLPINGTHVDSAAPVTITFGDPTALRLTRNAAGATSGAPFATQPMLNIEDAAGNIVADSALEVSVTETETQVLAGTRTLAATAGQVDFTGSGMMLSGSVATGLNLKYATTYNGTEISTTQTINLDPGLAVALTIGQQPTTVKTRVAFNPVPTVVLRDAAGNQVTSDSASTVTALLKDAGGNPVGAETSAFTASGGLVTFTGLSFQAPSTENYYVTFKLVSNSQAVTSNAFDILPGNATELRVTTAPSTLNQDQSLTMTGELLAQQPVVKLYDQDGNLVTTTNTGAATIRVKSGSGGDLTAGSTTATYTGGIATFSGVKLIGTPGVDYVLEFTNSSPSLTSTASSAMRVVHNVADHLAITTAASGGKAGTRFSTQPVITVLDRYDNVVTDGPGSDALVTANAAITAQGSTVLGTPLPISPSNAEVAAVNGVARFDSLTISGLVSNTYALTYSLDLAGIAAQTQSNITITYGSFNHLTIRTQPVGGNATGDALSVQPVIELRDGSENIVADPAVHSTLNASISSADGLTLLDNTLANPSLARLENASGVSNSGVVTFTQLKLLGLPGTSYTLKFAINTRFTTSTSVTVTHAAAHHLTITQQPTGGNATGENLAGQPIVQLRDRFENVVTSNSSDVVDARIATATGVSLTGTTTATLAAGVATFAGLKVIALPDTDYTLDFTTTVGANSVTSAATNSFRVTYSTPAKLAMVQQPVGGTTGTALTTQPIVEVQDFYGNRVFNYSGSITAAVGGSGSTLTSASASDRSAVVTNGRASFTDLALTATPATDYQLSFSAGSLVGVNSANVQVVPGAPVRIEILNQPIGAQTGAALAGQPVVRVVDTFGNLVTQDNSTVITAALTSGTGGTLSRVVSSQSVAITSTVSGGVATFSNLFMRGLTNHNYKLTFTSGNLVLAVSEDFTVSHAAVDRLIWETQPTVGMTGSPLTRAAVLELQDLDGNVATSDSTTVVTAAVTTGVGGSLTFATATANQGVVTFTNLVLTGTPGVTYKLTFTGAIGGSTVTALESDGLVPVHAVPAKVTTRGGNVVGALSGENLASQPSLYVRDRFDNIATSDNSTVVTASILDDVTGSVSGNVTATAVNGVVTFSGLKVAGTPGTDYALRYTADWSGTTLTSATSNLFHVSKVATVTLSYATQAYSPNAVVRAAFYTDSPGGITYTSSASALVCELDPGTGDLTIKGAGDCLVRVAVAIDQNGFYLANSAEATLVITKATQAAVNITSPAAVDYWSGLTPVAAGGSGTGAYSLSVVEGSICRLIGATILPGDAGSLCQITATRAGDTNYLPQTSAVQTIVVRKINQADLAIASANSMTVDSLNLFTSGGSGTGLVSYSLVSAGTANCSIAGAVLSATSSGTCSIRATKAASINYNVVTSPPQTITVRKDSQTVAFTSTAPMNPIVLGTYVPTATATSALAVTFTVANGSTCAVDNVDPGKITFTSVGLCEIIATQAGSNRYASASVRQFIQVGALNQTINFDVIPDLAFGTPAFKLAPTTNAGTRAVITLATTSNSTACSLADGIVTLNQAGVCEIVAAQGGYGSYSAASDVVRTFNVLADQAGAPHIFSSSVATHSITASFTPPSYTGGSPITGFVLVATDTAGNSYENAACPIVGSTITCTIVGIPNDVAYTAVARAITTAGRGAVSNVSMSQTPIDAPMAVTNLTATTSSNDLIVTWTPPIVAAGAGVTGYDVYVAPIGEALPATTPYRVNGATASSTTITNLLNPSATPSATPTPSPSETIAPARISFRRASISSPSPSASNTTPSSSVSAPAGYQVRIVTLIGSIVVASDTNTTNGFQTNFSVPLSPSQLTLTVTGNDLMTSWSAPTADGGSPVTGYDVKVNGSVICAATTSLFCEFTGMQPGRTYSVEVLAINAVGSSAASASSHSVAALPSGPGAGAANASMPNGMTILGISAKTALTNGGQLLILNARNFAGVTSVTLEGKPVKIVSNSEDHITLELPAHEPGPVDLIFKSKIGTLVFQDAVTFIAPPRADALQTFSRYRTNFVATNARMVASIKAVVLAKEAPKAMVCVGLVPVKYTANDVKLAKIRAANVCAVGAKLDGNLAVRSTTGITKLTGPAARAVKVTYKY